jgi:hypothetical protein
MALAKKKMKQGKEYYTKTRKQLEVSVHNKRRSSLVRFLCLLAFIGVKALRGGGKGGVCWGSYGQQKHGVEAKKREEVSFACL